MSQLYYLAASLPFLLPETEGEFRHSDFLEGCQDHLSPKEWNILNACRLDLAGDGLGLHPLLNRWIRWETSLRNEVVLLRAPSLDLEPEEWIREEGGFPGLSNVVREAVQQENPLEAERILDNARWSFLDEIGAGHFFDFEALLVYSLKLQLLERQGWFAPEDGETEYRRIYDLVVDRTRKAGAF